MKIYTLNLKKIKYTLPLFKVLISIALILAISIGALEYYIRSDAYFEAVDVLNEENLIIIDPGHGGEDPGTVSAGGIYEKDLNLQYALTLGELLIEEGFAVLYTRTEDKLLYTPEEDIKGIRKISDVKNRCKIAAEYPNAIFISIHMNSYSNPKYKGLQVYYSDKNPKSYALASRVQATVKDKVQYDNNRKIKRGDNIYVLENCDNVAVLIECGFLSNTEECLKLSEKEYRKSLCFSIVCGIIEYKEKQNHNN